MQLKTAYQDVQASGIEQSRTMEISDDPVIWRFLTDQLYTQKNAWIREYAQNARDVDPNWRIVLPSLHSTECQFIDNGPGMSKEFMLTRFCQAGFSTKRDSDNQSGGFGIGRLSGPQGTIIECRNEDAIRTWALVKNKNSIPSVSLLTEQPRPDDVPIGVTVRVPVRPAEIESVKKDVMNFLKFYNLPGLPEIKYVIKRPTWAIVDAPQDYSSGENPPLVEVGGYTFSAKWDQISSAANHLPHDVRALMQNVYRSHHGPYVLVHVPIGSVNIALNRESIKFDEDTVTTLANAAKEIRDEIANTVQSEMDKAKTMWDAKLTYGRLAKSNLGGLWEHVKNKLTWKGVPVKSNHYEIAGSHWRVSAENFRHRSSRSRATTDDLPLNVRPSKIEPDHRSSLHLLPEEGDRLVFVAVDTDDAVSRRLRAQFNRKNELWYIWPPKPGQLPDGTLDPKWKMPTNWWQPFIDHIQAEGSDHFHFMKLSDITPLPVAPRIPKAPAVAGSTANVVRNKFFRMNNCYTSFEPYDVDVNDTTVPYLWLPFHRDDLEPGETVDKVEKHKPWWRQGQITPNPMWSGGQPQIHLLQHVMPNELIIGVPRSQRKNVPSHWVHACDYAINLLPDKKEWPDLLARTRDAVTYGVADESLLVWGDHVDRLLKRVNPKHPFVVLMDEARADVKKTTEANKAAAILRLFDIQFTSLMKKDVKLRNFQKEFKDLVAGTPALSILTKVASSQITTAETQFLVANA